MADFTPTEEQEEALGYFLAGESLSVVAGAGTGKTALAALMASNTSRPGIYVTFSRALALEARRRVALTCDVSTTHSLAFRSYGKDFGHRLGGERVRSYKLARLLGIDGPLIVQGPEKVKVLQPGYLASLVMRAMQVFYQSDDDNPGPQHVPFIEGIDEMGADGRRSWKNNDAVRQELLEPLARAWADVQRPDGVLPYSHDAYLCGYVMSGDAAQVKADYLLADEGQDSNGRVLRWLKEQRSTQPVIIGDSSQMIFGWRGALDLFQYFETARTCHLTRSFRFGPAIAEVANAILERLPTDLRLVGSSNIDSRVGPVAQPKAILCRSNAAAVDVVLRLQKQGRSPHLVGGGDEVLRFAQAAARLMDGQQAGHPDLACFDSWLECVRYSAEDPSGGDLVTLVKIVEEYGVDTIIEALDGMGAEDASDVIVSTGHRGKGREWSSVRLAGDFAEPGDSPATLSGAYAEWRLQYVAATRAQHELDVSAVPHLQKMAAPATTEVAPCRS